MLRLYMSPTPSEAATDDSNSINQITIRLQKALPAHGVELTENLNEADLTAYHAGQSDRKRCDVAMMHGLYPTAYASITTGWHWGANQRVTTNLMNAKAITVPSQWVADILRRDLHVDPHVIGWAIDPADWEPTRNEGYILFNKTRVDGVCSPEPMIKLAALSPEYKFLSTFGEGTPNIRTTGRVVFEEMKRMVQGASVYLGLVKETFGIGTLEAMACGIPVLGFRHGATPDIVQHGVTGFLAAPGDYAALREGLDYCMKYRDILGENARIAALQYTWDRVAEQFAAVYRGVMAEHVGAKVAVVIPCHNYGHYVEQTLNSICDQQTSFPYEVIVVNDGSTDNTPLVLERAKRNWIESGNPNCIQIIHQENTGVAEARNRGIRASSAPYICCIDADDVLLDSRYLQTLSDALDADNRLGMAFTGLRVMNAEGQLGGVNAWPNGYDYDRQTARHNQVPTCCLYRKEAWARAGGYRKKYTPAEDAELWLRIGALGFTGKQVTTEAWFGYRLHGNSLSSTVRTGGKAEPDWIGDKPWIANGQRPFASDGTTRMGWPVRNYDQPKVSVIIPVSAYHVNKWREAVDSVEAQTELYWECIVVNDSGTELDMMGMPFVRVVECGKHNAAAARNAGIRAATAPFITFLDADDVFDPTFLEKTLRQYAIYGKYVYTDWYSLNKAGDLEYHKTPEFDPVKVFRQTSIHSINILIPKADLLSVGLFDETMNSWEDTHLFMKLAAAGICGQRLAEPLITYRYTSGQLRERGEAIKGELLKRLRTEFAEEMKKDVIMCCGQEPKVKPVVIANPLEGSPTDGMVRILYDGPKAGHEVIGLATKTNYRYRQAGATFYVYIADQQMEPDKFQAIAEINIAQPAVIPDPPVLVAAKA